MTTLVVANRNPAPITHYWTRVNLIQELIYFTLSCFRDLTLNCNPNSVRVIVQKRILCSIEKVLTFKQKSINILNKKS